MGFHHQYNPQKRSNCIKGCGLSKSLDAKGCEIKCGSHKMDAMMLMIIKVIIIHIIAAISLPPPLNSLVFSHSFLKAAPLYSLRG